MVENAEISEPTLQQKTDAILSTIPENCPPEVKVIVDLVKLLLEEVNKSDFASLKSLIEVQKTVTDKLSQENKRLRDDNTQLSAQLHDLENRVDENEQHDRNINLVLMGIPEENPVQDRRGRQPEEKTTEKFVAALNEHFPPTNKLELTDIARSHRLGKRNHTATKPRPIIARFALETKKLDTFRLKKHLKGARIYLAENLTSHRAKLYKAAREKLEMKNVWTWEGRIFASHGGRKIQIRSLEDIPGYDPSDMNLFS